MALMTTKTAVESQRVEIVGPNLNDQSTGDFHVHANTCRELLTWQYKGVRDQRPRFELWITEAESVQEIVEEIYSDILEETGESWETEEGSVHVFPCVTLPRETPKAHEPWPLQASLAAPTTNQAPGEDYTGQHAKTPATEQQRVESWLVPPGRQRSATRPRSSSQDIENGYRDEGPCGSSGLRMPSCTSAWHAEACAREIKETDGDEA